MGVLIIILLGVIGGGSWYFYHLMCQMNELVSSLDQELIELRKQLNYETSSDQMPSIEPRMQMVIELNDPIGVAARESKMAELVGHIAPNLLKKKVYEMAIEEAKKELARYNVEGKVELVIL